MHLLDQRLAEHKGKGEREDKDEEPLPIENKGSSKDVEDRTEAWDKHFRNHMNQPEGEKAYKAHVETQKGNHIEEMMDQKSYAQKKGHHHGHHHHHHSLTEAGSKDDLCTEPTTENMIKAMDQFSRTF